MRIPRGWKHLTREQPRTLAAIVQYSKSHADLVPNASDLADDLNNNLAEGIKRITKEAARERIARLKPYFIRENKALKINTERLCTAKESVLFLLAIQSMSPEDSNGRVFKIMLFDELKSQCDNLFTNDKLEYCWSKGVETDYLIQITSECVRPGELITYQLEYLKIIANQ